MHKHYISHAFHFSKHMHNRNHILVEVIRIKQAYRSQRQIFTFKLSENSLFWLGGRVKKATTDSTRIIETMFLFITVNRNDVFMNILLLQSISYSVAFRMNSGFKF